MRAPPAAVHTNPRKRDTHPRALTHTHSRTHIRTHTHTLTHTHIHTGTNRTHVLIERRVGFVIVTKHASRISGTQTTRILENQSTRCENQSAAVSHTNASSHARVKAATNKYPIRFKCTPNTCLPLQYHVHRQYDNLASFPRTCRGISRVFLST